MKISSKLTRSGKGDNVSMVVPKSIRQLLDLSAGDSVEWVISTVSGGVECRVKKLKK